MGLAKGMGEALARSLWPYWGGEEMSDGRGACVDGFCEAHSRRWRVERSRREHFG